jgi:hypothetical protein
MKYGYFRKNSVRASGPYRSRRCTSLAMAASMVERSGYGPVKKKASTRPSRRAAAAADPRRGTLWIRSHNPSSVRIR